MLIKSITFNMSVEDFEGLDIEEYAVDIAELVANGATAGKSLDGKVRWNIYNDYMEDEEF